MDEPLTMRRGGQDYYYLADDSHNVVALTDSAGAVVERYGYGNFGQPTVYDASWQPQTTPVGNPYLFTGRRWDGETGLYWFRTRYYDPRTGRFISRDTIGIWGDLRNLGNGLTYVDNPWSLLDPFGFCGNKDSWWKSLKKSFLCGDSNASDEALQAAWDSWSGSNADRTNGALAAATENVTLGLVSGESIPSVTYDNVTFDAANRESAKSTAGTIIATTEMAIGGVGIAKGVAKHLGREGVEQLATRSRPLLNPPIKINQMGLSHVLDRHTVSNIAKYAGKSKFNAGEDIVKLIEQGTQQPMLRQANGRFARIFDIG